MVTLTAASSRVSPATITLSNGAGLLHPPRCVDGVVLAVLNVCLSRRFEVGDGLCIADNVREIPVCRNHQQRVGVSGSHVTDQGRNWQGAF
ncbi:hypothetical protein [Burkholderia sp. Ac-20379]|uniref:hypothetical protein n=1 Tax=Burkholderia sp. Ac-20379 TaxID=2703900 RepID=UPI00197E7328|nr:hypothetical protein [Burkholderia sp. Ac-20379]MBN3723098.1 hypothetical protein [Burkholderia sp. Ac-20379]